MGCGGYWMDLWTVKSAFGSNVRRRPYSYKSGLVPDTLHNSAGQQVFYSLTGDRSTKKVLATVTLGVGVRVHDHTKFEKCQGDLKVLTSNKCTGSCWRRDVQGNGRTCLLWGEESGVRTDPTFLLLPRTKKHFGQVHPWRVAPSHNLGGPGGEGPTQDEDWTTPLRTPLFWPTQQGRSYKLTSSWLHDICGVTW